MRRIILVFILALASSALARPARAQFIYGEIPWGSDVRATTRGLAAQGFTLEEDFEPAQGELLYFDEEGVMGFATFADGRLAGLRFAYTGTADEMEDMYAQTLQDARRTLGEPQSQEDDIVSWENGGTWFMVLLGATDDGLPFMAVQYAGPGYHEEIDRRSEVGAGAAFPELDPRWTVVLLTPEFRTSLDRTSINPQGGGIVRAWAREDYAVPITDPVTYDQTVYQLDYDCTQRRTRMVVAVFRYRGQQVQTDNGAPAEPWIAMEPETSGEQMLLTVCQGAGR